MKLTTKQLRKLIKEELREVMRPGGFGPSGGKPGEGPLLDVPMQNEILRSEHLRLWVEDIVAAGGEFPGSPPTWPAKVGNAIIREFGLIKRAK